jgi:hypothetical protein
MFVRTLVGGTHHRSSFRDTGRAHEHGHVRRADARIRRSRRIGRSAALLAGSHCIIQRVSVNGGPFVLDCRSPGNQLWFVCAYETVPTGMADRTARRELIMLEGAVDAGSIELWRVAHHIPIVPARTSLHNEQGKLLLPVRLHIKNANVLHADRVLCQLSRSVVTLLISTRSADEQYLEK